MAVRPLHLTAGPAWALLAASSWGIGAGPVNGDAAAYAAQVESGAYFERWTHTGYVLAASAADALARGAIRVPVLLDLGSLAAALCAVTFAARHIEREGGDGRLAALAVTAVILPWAVLGEVDLPWIVLVVLSMGGSAAWLAGAIAISPTALLALPVMTRGGRPRALAGWSIAAVLVLSGISGGDWWLGPRGVLLSEGISLGRTLEANLLHLPWAFVLLRPRDTLSILAKALPLLLAPPDVPVWMLPGILIALEVSGAPRADTRWLRWAIVWQLTLGIGEGVAKIEQVRRENALIEELVARLGPTDGLVAPFYWGARVAVAKTGDPYGIPWHPPGRFLRDQRISWCESHLTQIIELPPQSDGILRWRAARPEDEAACR